MEKNPQKSNIVWHDHSVTREDRQMLKKQNGCLLWFTGLSGSGKSTIANVVEQELHTQNFHTFLLDGDNIRHGLNAPPELLHEKYGQDYAKRFGLGFSEEDRTENIRRIGAIGQLFCESGLITLAAFVSPFQKDRTLVRNHLTANGNADDFIEIFVDAPVATCQERDPKGLYRKASEGKIKNFTGISSPYEPPQSPEIHLRTDQTSVEESARIVIEYLKEKNKLS
ncbi:MAG: adenylyl-sulfate kinase [Pirellulaceae bacterium]|nr:adenylyl-sulfate kinase [Pirellulaceae bacterium]